MNSLLEEANSLNLKKQDIELKLAQNKEDERNLIDKIKRETGEDPNLYEILQNINN
jgi:predicted methyltransferase MtxX (methanogen marker protein 4)